MTKKGENMIKNVRVDNGWIFVEKDNGLTSTISLNSPTGDGQLERWYDNYVYVRVDTWRLTYDEDGRRLKEETVY